MALRPEHPAEETLHALAAGEVDPARRAAIEAHVMACPECQASLRRVEAARQIFQKMAPPPVDDLTWQRMSRRVQAELRDRAEADLRGPERLGPRLAWAVSVLLVAVLGGAAMWLTLRSVPNVEVVPPPALAIRWDARAVLVAGRLPLSLSLGPRVLTLGSGARVLVADVAQAGQELLLANGRIEIVSPLEVAVVVEAPPLRAVSRQGAFLVRLVGNEVHVEAQIGPVIVERPGAPTFEVAPGQRVRVGEAGAPDVIVDLLAPKAVAPPPAPAAPRRGRAPLAAPSAGVPPVEEAPQASLSVEVIAPSDPLHEAFLAYDRGDLDSAITLGRQVAEGGQGAVAAAQAQSLLCDAYLGARAPAAAVAACEAALSLSPEPLSERDRARHLLVAGLYRSLLGDCDNAIRHYDRAVIFGRQSLSDDEALLGRADCALSLGRVNVAERDLALLAGREAELAGRERFQVLLDRLEAVRTSSTHR